ncbi:phosphotransferase [Streptomyces sulphureus]|uniref:phosphotransferase n=1 Tax=Streptomyces sulphureus TaxID=47758 RepID=UPI000371AF8E|nr:phosphotransferase [Streptomyces sulphureus]
MRRVPTTEPELAPHTVTELLRRYGAGEPLDCERVTHGLLNRGYRVETTGGRYFLKQHLAAGGPPRARSAAVAERAGSIEERHRAAARLGALGLPVVPVCADAEGRTVLALGDHCYALHPWLEGRHRFGTDLSPAQCRRLGALLGQVHLCLAEVLPDPATGAGARGVGRRACVPGTPAPAAPADPEETEARIAELLARVRRSAPRDGFDELAEHRLRERRRLLRRYAACRPADAAAEAGWVHGDFHPLNLLYPPESSPLPVRARAARAGAPRTEEPGPLAILDWDRIGLEPPPDEAVRGALLFFLRTDGTLDLPRVRAYADGYRRASGASAPGLAAAVHRVWWERLNDFWMLRWRYELHDPRADPQFPAASALVVWWTSRYEEVGAAFCGSGAGQLPAEGG